MYWSKCMNFTMCVLKVPLILTALFHVNVRFTGHADDDDDDDDPWLAWPASCFFRVESAGREWLRAAQK